MSDPRQYPDIAEYHSGPYLVAAILQDPGTIHGNQSGATRTRKLGVLNPDPTAALCRLALETNAIPLSAYLPLNAIPWFDAPAHRSMAMLREGAAHNCGLILRHKVKLVLLLGGLAHRSAPFLNLPSDTMVRFLPHPGRLGLINYREDGQRIGASLARRRLIDGFRLPQNPPNPPNLHFGSNTPPGWAVEGETPPVLPLPPETT